ncbi:hypothetical protein D9Q98_002513 [Chlorella vulgaris]|uniref:DUF262 domain-containing protein n=1 Tax=Chlorella vulgaris TaxID=3077 RepID=A0A9D4YZF3_CHLVU|nr:hypothetical protein D9Q98_002513 [Chlorella vulgaris]
MSAATSLNARVVHGSSLGVERGAALPPNPEHLFFSATQPLSVWLNSANFHYTIDAVQRDYEWDEMQVLGLLDTIAQVKKKSDQSKTDAVVKLSEVVLLDKSARDTAAVRQTLQNNPKWYETGNSAGTTTSAQPRIVSVIDGQQRITTLVIIAAVAQFKLLQVVQQLSLAPINEVYTRHKAEAQQVVTDMMARFTRHDGQCILRRSTDGDMGLADGIFNFITESGTDVDTSDLAAVLEEAMDDAASRYHLNAIHTSNWFDQRLHLLQPPGQAAWLLSFVRALLTRVFWTTTLTCSSQLALDTFLNVNLGSHRVALSEPNVIKVALIADLVQRDLDSAVRDWDKCITKLTHVALKLVKMEDKMPYIKYLSSEKLGLNAATALTLDFLRHVCFIQRLVEPGASSPLAVQDIGRDELIQHFADYRMSKGCHWSAKTYITNTLQQYVSGYCTMLTWKVHSDINDFSGNKMEPDSKTSLVILLSLPDTSWRPAAMAVIREISKDAKAMGMAETRRQKLLTHSIKQLEFVALWLAALSTACVARKQLWQAVAKYIIDAGLSPAPAGGISRMEAATGYKHGEKKLVRAVILGIELSEIHKSSHGGGIILEGHWEDKLTLEHLLPQNPDPSDVYWTNRFGGPKGFVHDRFCHLLGNLCILTLQDNSRLGRNNMDVKLSILEKREIDMETIKYLKVNLDENGWNICAILGRQEDLLKKFAKRYDIEVPPAKWRSWRLEVLQDVITNVGSIDTLLLSDATKAMINETDTSRIVSSTPAVATLGPDEPAAADITKAKKKITLKDLIDGGQLRPGRGVLSRTYRNQTRMADLLDDGKISLPLPSSDGEECAIFDSVSGFSSYVIRMHPLGGISQSGHRWSQVKYKDSSLDVYRTQLARKRVADSVAAGAATATGSAVADSDGSMSADDEPATATDPVTDTLADAGEDAEEELQLHENQAASGDETDMVPASRASTEPAAADIARAKRIITLRDLIDAGQLRPGRGVLSRKNNDALQADLLENGQISLRSPAFNSGECTNFDSVSGFSGFARAHQAGYSSLVSLYESDSKGWSMVQHSGRSLDDYRTQLARKRVADSVAASATDSAVADSGGGMILDDEPVTAMEDAATDALEEMELHEDQAASDDGINTVPASRASTEPAAVEISKAKKNITLKVLIDEGELQPGLGVLSRKNHTLLADLMANGQISLPLSSTYGGECTIFDSVSGFSGYARAHKAGGSSMVSYYESDSRGWTMVHYNGTSLGDFRTKLARKRVVESVAAGADSDHSMSLDDEPPTGD